MREDLPIFCNMDVFTPDQRESHIQATTKLFQAVQSVQAVENGYEFRFPNENEFILRIAEFISNERLCCPFLSFTLDVLADREFISLALTGPIGTQEFLRDEFNGAFK